MDHTDPIQFYLAHTPMWKLQQDRAKAIAAWSNGKSTKFVDIKDIVKEIKADHLFKVISKRK